MKDATQANPDWEDPAPDSETENEAAKEPRGEVVVLPARSGAIHRSPRMIRHARETARLYTQKAINLLVRQMGSRDEKIAQSAAIHLLNRGWGQPSMDVKVEDNRSASPGDMVERERALVVLRADPEYLKQVHAILSQVGISLAGESVPREVEPQGLALTLPAFDGALLDATPPEDAPEEPKSEPDCVCGCPSDRHPSKGGCTNCRCTLYTEPTTES